METFSALLALCAGNSPVTGEFPSQRPVTQIFDVFFDLRLNNSWVNNREVGDLRRHRAHYDVTVMSAWRAPVCGLPREVCCLDVETGSKACTKKLSLVLCLQFRFLGFKLKAEPHTQDRERRGANLATVIKTRRLLLWLTCPFCQVMGVFPCVFVGQWMQFFAILGCRHNALHKTAIMSWKTTLIARFMGPTWGPSGGRQDPRWPPC